MAVGRFAVALLLLGIEGCGAPPAREQAPGLAGGSAVAQSSSVVTALPAACGWVVGAGTRVTPENVLSADVAVSGERALFAYQVVNGDRGQGIRVRVATKEAIGPARDVSEGAGFHVSPHVLAVGSRFLVSWNHQLAAAGEADPRGAVEEARWIAEDGMLGPVIELPFDTLEVHLERVAGGFSGLWERQSADGKGGVTRALTRQLLDESLRPRGVAVTLLDGSSDADEVTLADATTWVVAVGPGFRARGWRPHLVHLDAKGAVVSPVVEVASELDAGSAYHPSLLDVGDGLLVGYLSQRQTGPAIAEVFVAKVDYEGHVVVPPRRVGRGGNIHAGGGLNIAAGAPAVTFDGSRIVGLDRDGTPRSAAIRLGPETAVRPFWVETKDAFGVAWLDRVGDDQTLWFAPVHCASLETR